MNKRTQVHLKPHLLTFERPPQTDQQRVVGEFLARVGEIGNFVILAQSKDGKIILFPCVDTDPGVALFIDVCRARLTADAAERLVRNCHDGGVVSTFGETSDPC